MRRSVRCCSALRTFPASELRVRRLRIYVISPYVVIYEGSHESETVIVHRVVHGRRDIKPDMLKGSPGS
jgi:hypothetical protein